MYIGMYILQERAGGLEGPEAGKGPPFFCSMMDLEAVGCEWQAEVFIRPIRHGFLCIVAVEGPARPRAYRCRR